MNSTGTLWPTSTNREPPTSNAAVEYAKAARRFAQRNTVAVRAARCELNSILLAKALFVRAELIGNAADAADISKAERDVRALESALRDSCLGAKRKAQAKVKAKL